MQIICILIFLQLICLLCTLLEFDMWSDLKQLRCFNSNLHEFPCRPVAQTIVNALSDKLSFRYRSPWLCICVHL